MRVGGRRASCCAQLARERTTSYTLWHSDRLVGRTDLDYPGNGAESRMGALVATDYGELLIAGMTDADGNRGADDGGDADAVPLQLRGPDGAIIATRAIVVHDTDRLVSHAHDGPDEAGEAGFEPDAGASPEQQWLGESRPTLARFDECIDESDDVESDFAATSREPWAEPAIPRYHIVVELTDAWSIP